MIIQGWDVSPNHAACVELEWDGAFVPRLRWWAVATQAITTVQAHGQCTYLPDLAKVSKHLKAADRLARLAPCFDAWAARKPDFAVIEDYALGVARGAHYTGEVGGVARGSLLRFDVPWRLLPIKGVKKAVAGRGDADKTDVELAVARFGFVFDGKLDVQSAEDLHDAASMALVCLFEQQHRAGLPVSKTTLEVLKSTSKANPLPLMDRPWITRLALESAQGHSAVNGRKRVSAPCRRRS